MIEKNKKQVKKGSSILKKKPKYVWLTVERIENLSGFVQGIGNWSLMIGNIKISNSISGKKETVHIKTGRADSLEGGDFKVSELEKAIQDFFDKNF